ncbi:DUF7537 family lipoprotein [Nocardioides daejeonensis]|uniref:DUF7537 family lipoprotein n=1 Tax=Nocardioides daejeonensis TaxID=1046556 RepID=UPI000D740709|nr:LppX_LprAFG lipoprotein [Nocardioides daejeonensis]
MRTNITRRLAAAAVVPVVLLGLAACNDDDKKSDSDKPKETISQESTPQTDAPETDTPETNSGEAISNDDFAKLIGDGIEATTTAKMKMEITASGVATTAEGVMDYTGDQPATQMTMTVPGAPNGGKMDVIMVDGVIYMTMPIEGQKGYMKIDPKANPELEKQMGGLSNFDMATMMESFTKGLKKVETIGSEDIDGVDTTHYRVTVDTAEAAAMLGDLGAEGAEVPKELTYDIWLDGEGRFTQMQADLDGQGSMKMNVFDWGADVDIKAPPANQVQDMSEMMGGLSKQ